MCIYCTTSNYRKIYENHHGPILRESNGRAYEVHHIDGNHENNDPVNLTLLTIQEHYHVHYSRGDYGACFLMATQRMDKTPEEISEISKLTQQQRVENKTHNFLDGTVASNTQSRLFKEGTHNFIGLNKKRVNEKTHNFLGGKILGKVSRKLILDGTHPFMTRPDGTSLQQDLVKAGKHILQGGKIQKEQLASGTHPSKIKIGCIQCRRILSKNGFNQHLESCS